MFVNAGGEKTYADALNPNNQEESCRFFLKMMPDEDLSTTRTMCGHAFNKPGHPHVLHLAFFPTLFKDSA